MTDKAKKAILASAIAVAVIYEVRARRAIMGQVGAEPATRATAYYGAMTLYGDLATYFGRKAIVAETKYWEAIRNG